MDDSTIMDHYTIVLERQMISGSAKVQIILLKLVTVQIWISGLEWMTVQILNIGLELMTVHTWIINHYSLIK